MSNSTPFTLAPDAIAPASVPQRTLFTGAKMPAVGLGTFGSDRYSGAQIAEAVRGAIASGYRHIDCASVYGNEKLIGAVFQEIIASGVIKREELWITSKVWNDMHGAGDVLLSVAQTLKDLRLDYLDLFLVHWPFPNFHAPGCSGDARNPNSKPYIHENYMKTWRQMERLVDAGLVRHIGCSNMTLPKMNLLLRDARIKPACNEMEMHPHFQQLELFKLCVANQVQPIGFCPIGSPSRPERDKTAQDTTPTHDPVILEIARQHNVHPAVICVKWAVQHGQIPIPFAVNPAQYRANLACSTTAPLSAEEMAAIAGLDQNCRLIKGQVFLWRDNQTWEDLWDPNDIIPT